MEDSSYLTLTHQMWESEQAALHQVQDDQERVIAYANRALNKAERKIISLLIIYRESVLNWALFKIFPIWNIYNFKTGDKIFPFRDFYGKKTQYIQLRFFTDLNTLYIYRIFAKILLIVH